MTPIIDYGIVTRCVANPILTKDQVPFDAELIFNAGVTKFNGKYVMVFRNDYGKTEEEYRKKPGSFRTNLGLATSDDGIRWEVAPEPVFRIKTDEFHRAYDPRLTVIDGRCYMCFAANSPHGIRGGIAVTDDFCNFDILYLSEPDNRNMVLFPEKIGGDFCRLDRPMPVYCRPNPEAFDLWLSRSPNLRYWGGHRCLLTRDDVPMMSNCKVGPGAPPIKTAQGWLTTFHAVWKLDECSLDAWHSWNKIYSAGIMLLDLDDPSKILGIADKPLLAPAADYEKKGFRGSVIFPGGMILEESGEVKIYYGAADTVECLATANVDELIKLCKRNTNTNPN